MVMAFSRTAGMHPVLEWSFTVCPSAIMLSFSIKAIYNMALKRQFMPTHTDIMVWLLFWSCSVFSVSLYQLMLNVEPEPIVPACAEPEIIVEE
jgi:hypothetical protein